MEEDQLSDAMTKGFVIGIAVAVIGFSLLITLFFLLRSWVEFLPKRNLPRVKNFVIQFE